MWISRKMFNQLKAETEELLATAEDLKKRAVLIGIERSGRTNKFTFVRGAEVHQIETMGLISDDLPKWKEKLLR